MTNKFFCSVLMVGLLCLTSASADIVVEFNPALADIEGGVGDTILVDIVADIPEADAVLSWGLDLNVFDPGIADWTLMGIGGSWEPVQQTPDGDLLGGLAFPDCIWGEDILLATVQFTGYANGSTAIWLGDNYPDDLTEGFALCETGFADVMYGDGLVIVPEPASIALLALCGLAVLRRR